MKKEMIIVIILLILVLIFSFILQKYTSKSIEQLDNKLNDLGNITEKIIYEKNLKENSEDIDKMYSELKEVEQDWEKINKKMSYYLEHDELEKVDSLIVTIKKNIQIDEFDDASKDIASCIFILNHLNDKISLKLKNLF